ncbi:MAG TPA: leucyl/phenylalanyl-tRNA--protein transferase [Terriglobia bacterium]|nr:leucyl/phenylalanyl-tRNA--protein transferase [Terriglobia bacterium]
MSDHLSPDILLDAYREGWFPMAEHGRILWFLPDPRAIIPLDGFHVSRSLQRTERRGLFDVRFNTDFPGVMRACADRNEGTWISDEFHTAYEALHQRGFAHTAECWRNRRLVGGVYGVSIGGVFMAESMFHRETDAGKVALHALVNRLRERRFALLEVQYLTPNLGRLGAIEIPGRRYLKILARERDRVVTF